VCLVDPKAPEGSPTTVRWALSPEGRKTSISEALGDFSRVTSQLFVSQLPKRVNRFAVHIQLE